MGRTLYVLHTVLGIENKVVEGIKDEIAVKDGYNNRCKNTDGKCRSKI